MNINEFCNSIGLSPSAAKECSDFKLSQNEIESEYKLLLENTDSYCEKAKENPLRSLALFVNFAAIAKQEYEKRNISQAIFAETFKDIARWEAEYYAAAQKHGLTELGWLANHVKLQLFQIESLQFQTPDTPQFELPQELAKLPYLNIHIPKNADISPLAVDKACKAALEFFNYKKAVLCCGSWLLSPVLKELLNANSKIVLFGDRFNIVSCDYAIRQAEQRIFGNLCDDPSNYAESTSLQRAAKAYLINKGQIPCAYGYFVYSI